MRFEILIRNCPILNGHVLRYKFLAIARFGMTSNLEVSGKKAPMLSIPMDSRATDPGSRKKGAQVPHRQCGLVHGITKRQSLAGGLFKQVLAYRITQFILNMRGGEVRYGIAKLPALEGEYLETAVGQFLRQNRRRPAESDQHHIDPWHTGGHRLPLSHHDRAVPAHETHRRLRVGRAKMSNFVDVVI